MKNIFLLTCLFLAPDSGGGSGAPALTLEQRFSAAQTDLATANASIGTLTSERDTANGLVANLQTQVSTIQGQFDAATTTANDLRGQVTALTTEKTTLTSQVSTLTTERDTANGHKSRLEALCGVKGIDPTEAVPPAAQPEASQSVSDYSDRLAKAKSAAERSAVLKDFAEAAKTGKLKN